MTSLEEKCKGCNCSINCENNITIDNEEVCVDCATDILTQDDAIELIGKYLEPKDLINLKRTLKGFSPQFDIQITDSITKYRNTMLNRNIRGPLNGHVAEFHNFSGDEYPSFRLQNIEDSDIDENIEFFTQYDEDVMTNYLNGEYDFFDRDGDDYNTFAELLKNEEGIDSSESENIRNILLGNTSEIINEYTLQNVKKLILSNFILEFEPESSEFYMYKVSKEIEKNPSYYMVGDVFYAQEYLSSRPHYGLGIIGWNWEMIKKIPITDGEGEPELSQYLINKLIENKVSYDLANSAAYQVFFDDDNVTTWVLPNFCMIISNSI